MIKKLLKLIKKSGNSEVNSLSELTYNLLKGNVYCPKIRKKFLKPHIEKLRLLADKKHSLKKKRNILLKGEGLFLSTLLPIAISTIVGMLRK